MLIAETDRIIVRSLRDGDADALQHVLGDPEVMRYGPGALDPVAIRDWLSCRQAEYSQWGYGLWALEEKSLVQCIGYCGLTRFPDLDGQVEIEIGYRLARPQWGRGLATEAARAVRDHGFAAGKLVRLVALIDPNNRPSLRVAEKLGMRFEKDVLLPNYDYPDHLYVLDRARWSGADCRAGLE